MIVMPTVKVHAHIGLLPLLRSGRSLGQSLMTGDILWQTCTGMSGHRILQVGKISYRSFPKPIYCAIFEDTRIYYTVLQKIPC